MSRAVITNSSHQRNSRMDATGRRGEMGVLRRHEPGTSDRCCYWYSILAFEVAMLRIPGQERECALRAVLSPTLSSPRVHFKLAPFHINNARAKRSSAVSVATAHAPHAVARPRCYSAQPRSLARNSVARVPARSGEWRRARTVAAGTCARRVKPRETALRRTRLRVAGRIDRSVAAHAAPRVRVRLALQL